MAPSSSRRRRSEPSRSRPKRNTRGYGSKHRVIVATTPGAHTRLWCATDQAGDARCDFWTPGVTTFSLSTPFQGTIELGTKTLLAGAPNEFRWVVARE